MARGYPTPRPRDDAPPTLLPEGVCAICKRRPAREGDAKCEACAAALAS